MVRKYSSFSVALPYLSGAQKMWFWNAMVRKYSNLTRNFGRNLRKSQITSTVQNTCTRNSYYSCILQCMIWSNCHPESTCIMHARNRFGINAFMHFIVRYRIHVLIQLYRLPKNYNETDWDLRSHGHTWLPQQVLDLRRWVDCFQLMSHVTIFAQKTIPC